MQQKQRLYQHRIDFKFYIINSKYLALVLVSVE